MLEWNCHLKYTHPHWEGPENIPFTMTVRNTLVRRALASLKGSVTALVDRPDLTVGTAGTELS